MTCPVHTTRTKEIELFLGIRAESDQGSPQKTHNHDYSGTSLCCARARSRSTRNNKYKIVNKCVTWDDNSSNTPQKIFMPEIIDCFATIEFISFKHANTTGINTNKCSFAFIPIASITLIYIQNKVKMMKIIWKRNKYTKNQKYQKHAKEHLFQPSPGISWCHLINYLLQQQQIFYFLNFQFGAQHHPRENPLYKDQ